MFTLLVVVCIHFNGCNLETGENAEWYKHPDLFDREACEIRGEEEGG